MTLKQLLGFDTKEIIVTTEEYNELIAELETTFTPEGTATFGAAITNPEARSFCYAGITVHCPSK